MTLGLLSELRPRQGLSFVTAPSSPHTWSLTTTPQASIYCALASLPALCWEWGNPGAQGPPAKCFQPCGRQTHKKVTEINQRGSGDGGRRGGRGSEGKEGGCHLQSEQVKQERREVVKGREGSGESPGHMLRGCGLDSEAERRPSASTAAGRMNLKKKEGAEAEVPVRPGARSNPFWGHVLREGDSDERH